MWHKKIIQAVQAVSIGCTTDSRSTNIWASELNSLPYLRLWSADSKMSPHTICPRNNGYPGPNEERCMSVKCTFPSSHSSCYKPKSFLVTEQTCSHY